MDIIDSGERILPYRSFGIEKSALYFRHLFAYVFSTTIASKDSHVLDFGFGEGYGAKRLSENYTIVIGVDKDQNLVEHATKKYKHKNLMFYNKKDFDDSKVCFDLIVCFQVIEHIKDDIGFIHYLMNRLNLGGKILLTTPNRTIRIKNKENLWNQFHEREYSYIDLTNILNEVQTKYQIRGVQGSRIARNFEKCRVNISRNRIPSVWQKLCKQFSYLVYNTYLLWLKIKKHQFTIKDYYLIDKNFEEALDFLVILEKK